MGTHCSRATTCREMCSELEETSLPHQRSARCLVKYAHHVCAYSSLTDPMHWLQLLAVWVLADWKSRGEATPIQLVELGPGRGTLIKDVLRVGSNRVL